MNIPLRSLFLIVTASLSTAILASGQQSFITHLKDINTTALPPRSALDAKKDAMVNVNGTLFLAINDPVSGTELWKMGPGDSDFVFVKDINPGSASSSPKNLTAVGDTLFFFASATGTNSKDLWKSDGTRNGTVLVKEFSAITVSLPRVGQVSFQGALFFEGRGTVGGRELWKSDGTAAGTVMVKDINPEGGSGIDNLTIVGDSLFFTADDNTGQALWKTNGTTAGTVKVKAGVTPEVLPDDEESVRFVDVGGVLYFRASGDDAGVELWKSDGTDAGTGVVKDIQPGSASGGPRELTNVDGVLFFTADDGLFGRELWKDDGSVDDPSLVFDIRPGDTDGGHALAPQNFIAVNEFLFFTASQNGTGRELWMSDGINTGTVIVQDIVGGADGSNPENLTNLNGTLLFTVTVGSNDLQLWKSDGTAVNTTMVADLPETPDTGAAAISHLVVVGDTLFFKLNHDEVWRTDGTEAGTQLIRHFREGSADSEPASFAIHANEAYFAATNGADGREVWKTDGTPGGTVMVADIAPGLDSSSPSNFRSVNDQLFFSAADSLTGQELWMLDSQGNASMVLDINTIDARGSEPQHLTEFDGLLFFSADERHAAPERSSRRELWKSDGLPEGTDLVKDINPNGDASPADLIPMGNALYFTADDGTGRELWKTDGTTDGTVQVTTIGGNFDASPRELVRLGNALFFSAQDSVATGNKGRELWKSTGVPGSPGGEVIDIWPGGGGSSPAGLTVVKNFIFFSADDGVNGRELWRSSGTQTGTMMLKDIRPDGSSAPSQLVAVGDKIFFVADNGTHGAELWRSDGTPTGTVMVKDIVAGAGSPGIENITNVNGIACFSADDGVNGRELWVSDGTAAGTFMIPPDLTGDDSSSLPANLFAFNTGLLFSASTRGHGHELYLAAVGPEIQVEDPDSNVLVNGAGTVDFDTVAFPGFPGFPLNTLRTITIRNSGLNALTGIAASISGVHSADYTVVTKPAAIIAPGGSTFLVVKFTAKENGTRKAMLRIASNDSDESPFIVNLTGEGKKDPKITQQPLSQMVQVGQSVTFTAAAADPGSFTVQWRRNNGIIRGATDTTYDIFSAALTHAGAYTLQAINTAKVTATSDVAQLGVVESLDPKIVAVRDGTTVTMTVKAAGNGLSYRWRFNDGPLPAGDITGATTAKLMIKGLGLQHTGIYTCEVTGPSGPAVDGGTAMVVGGTHDLRVFDKPPVLTDPQLMPNGIVSGPYEYQILAESGNNHDQAPSTYSASGLPPNVKLDTKTGVIKGKPTKPGDYTVKLTASNSRGKSNQVISQINIADFPENVAGAYTGPVARSVPINGDLGGRFDLTVTGTGAFTGSLTLGTTKHALKGALNIALDGTPMSPAAEIDIKRSGILPPLKVTFDLVPDPLDSRVTTGKVTAGANEVAFNGWRNVWHATTNPASPFLGMYTFGMEASAPAPDIPLGYGYGSFTVANTGILKGAGKTPDGEAFTCAGFISRDGDLLVYQALFMPKGSVLGVLTIDPLDVDDVLDNTLAGSLSLMRPANGATTARIYNAGYGPIDLDALGGFYVRPVAPDMILGLTEPGGAANAQLIFEDGGLPAAIDPDITFNVGPKSKITMPVGVVANPAAVKLTLNAATGVFGGSFVLKDPELRSGTFAGKEFKRTATFSGILTEDGAGPFGAGFLKLEELPTDATPRNTNINFGSVRLQAVPPPPGH